MIKEQHIQCGDQHYFIDVISKQLPLTSAKGVAVESAQLWGIKVVQNRDLPLDIAVLIDKDGKIVQIFQLKSK